MFKIVLAASFISIVLFSCNLSDPDQIAKSAIDISYSGLPVIEMNTQHPINEQVKVPVRIEWHIKDTIYHQIYGFIEYKTGDLMGKEPKRSYSFSLQNPFAFAENVLKTNWLLDACYMDKTFSRDLLALHIAEKLNPDHPRPASQFALFYINGEYQGIYLLTEKPDYKTFHLEKNHGTIFKEPNVFNPGNLISNQIHPPIQIKNREKHLSDMKTFLFSSTKEEFIDPQQGVFSYFDKQNIIYWQIILCLTNSDEGLYKDFYLFAEQEDDLLKIAIRDYDHSFGRTWDNQLHNQSIDLNQQVLFDKLSRYNPGNYKELINSTWQHAVISGKLTAETLLSFTDSVTLLLKPFAQKNFEKFPIDGPLYHDSSTFEEEVILLKENINKQFETVNKRFGLSEAQK